MSIRCIKLRRHEKNTLRGFVDLVLRGCTWHEKNGQEWIGFPARSYERDDGTTCWQPLIEFVEAAKQPREQFQRRAIAAIHIFAEKDPGAAS